MTTWREKLQPGSFRGAPFYWKRADSDIGRKTARHDYPQRDEAYIEDLGKAPREFVLEVVVIGPDYMVARDALIAALEQPGPGTLIHPTMGTMQVSLNSKPRLSESTDEGGMARFSLPFIVAGPNKFPTATVDTAAIVATRATAAKAAVAANYVKVVKTPRFPAFVADSLSNLADKGIAAIGVALKAVSPPLLPGAAGSVLSKLGELRNSVVALARVPVDMVLEVQGVITRVNVLTSNPFTALKSLEGLFEFGNNEPAIKGTTYSRRQQAANQSAMTALVRQTAIIEAAALSAKVAYPSYQEAIAIRDELADLLDNEMETADDDTYEALTALRIAMLQDISARGGDLARLTNYTPQRTLPALVITHQLYGDATRSEEIISRNNVRHPGFVPGGVALEVVSNV
jgi:prophage DNA circulation protein